MPLRRSRSYGSSNRRTARRQTTWENLIIQHPHGTLGEQIITDITPEPMRTDLVGRATIVRCILKLILQKDTGSTSATLQQIGLGISVVTNDAFAALAVPDAMSDFGQDWYYWTVLQGVFAASAGPQPEVLADIRTARLLRSGYKLVLNSQSLSLNDLDTNLSIVGRLLWKLV